MQARISLAETPTCDSPSTSTTVDITCEAQAPETVGITDDQPKINRRRIKHDVLFKAEVLRKKDDGMTTADLLATYNCFNFDKTNLKPLRLLLTFRKRSCSKSTPPSNIKLFTRNCMLSSRKLGLKDII